MSIERNFCIDGLGREGTARTVRGPLVYRQREPIAPQHNPSLGQRDSIVPKHNVFPGQQDPIAPRRNPSPGQRESIVLERNPSPGQRESIVLERNASPGQREPIAPRRNLSPGQRRVMRTYGATFSYLKGEPRDADDVVYPEQAIDFEIQIVEESPDATAC